MKAPSVKTRLTALVAATVLAVSVPAASPVQASDDSPVTGVHLSWYPGAETGYGALAQHGVTSAPELLDALARDFADGPRLTSYGGTTTGAPDMQDFLVLWLPVWLDELMSGTAADTHGLDPSRPADLSKILWLAHVAGYYGGVWMRKNFLDSDVPLHAGLPFGNAGIDQFYGNFVDRFRAVADSGDPGQVLAATRATLRSDLVIAPSGIDSATLVSQILPPTDNLAAFAYDSTWLENLLPPHLDAPVGAVPGVDDLFTRDQRQLLGARYGIPEQAYLTRARAGYDRVLSATGEVKARYDQTVDGKFGEMPLQLAQQRFNLYGVVVYGIGLPAASNYRGFSQDEYDRVLTWAAYAVMGNQANSMNGLSAYAGQDVPAARNQLRATLVWAAYVGAYGWGHLNPAVTAAQPMSTLLPVFTRDGT
ncbi:hypothetical protein [Amycolatopsis sp.]|uniref:hypothetical protein n=1 Tax=Amycolatopsis sp. TaxID=37632 RepID=UPI002C8D305F|nr:hypothetical protein [Amycolatopsis sp.]HVV08213.1 hypothetical protein [Amycolatopsis sp.]